MRQGLGAIGLAALVALAGWGGSASAETSARPVQTFTASQTQIVGARPAEERLMRDVLRTLQPSQIASVRFLAGPTPIAGLPRFVELRIGKRPGPRGEWDAQLLADLYVPAAERMHLRHIDAITTAGGGATADGVTARDLTASRRHLKSVATLRRKLRSSSVHVLEVRHVASGVAVTVEADQPLEFVTNKLGPLLDMARKLAPDGLFFGVENTRGVLVYGVANSSNWGVFKAASRSLLVCGPVGVLGAGFGGPQVICPA